MRCESSEGDARLRLSAHEDTARFGSSEGSSEGDARLRQSAHGDAALLERRAVVVDEVLETSVERPWKDSGRSVEGSGRSWNVSGRSVEGRGRSWKVVVVEAFLAEGCCNQS